jgi:alpha-galactosidase
MWTSIRRSLTALAAASLVIAAVPVVASLPVLVLSTPAAALENGLARTPPMGFNNWNSTFCGQQFNEAMVKQIADIFGSRGLQAAGYQYVNIDDCWAKPQRNAQGNLEPDPVRFPNGIKAVADYVHSKGLKFGLYTSAGTMTCNPAGFPGGLGHEQQDANLFASWGVDYLKYDNCNNQGVDAIQRYTAMRNALAATGRPIVFSICEWGQNQPWLWASTVGNLWRTTGDIEDNWGSMLNLLNQNTPLAPYAKPGAWNDPDMLEVGNGGMTDTEYRTHFSMWAMMAAPLLIGTDLRSASNAAFDILTNRDVIAVDQDPLGRQGYEVRNDGGRRVYSKLLAGGDRAVALFNETSATTTIATTAAEVGMNTAASYGLKDLWSKATSTTSGTISASVPAHGTVVYRISGGGPYSGFGVRGTGSGKCLDVYGNAVNNGAAVEIFSCHSGANQRWNSTAAGELRVYDGTKCLDVFDNQATPGTKVELWQCNGGANQKFRLNADGSVTAIQSNLCLDVSGGATTDAAPIIVWTCHGGPNQKWAVV